MRSISLDESVYKFLWKVRAFSRFQQALQRFEAFIAPEGVVLVAKRLYA